MKDWDPGEQDPAEWLQELADWRDAQREARDRQAADRRQLDAAEQHAATLADWLARLTAAIEANEQRAAHLDGVAAGIAAADAAVAALEQRVAERDEARAVATARLLGGPATTTPLVLLPLRVQTRWDGSALTVRAYPDEIGVDRHDPRLTEDERAAGEAFWAMRGAEGKAETRQAWENLVRRTAPARAAWVARATGPGGGRADPRESVWETPVVARALPDRLAVVAFAGGEPVDVAASGEPPRFVTWGAPVADALDLDPLHEPGAVTWMTDVDRALEAGMAVRLADTGPVEELLVVGIRVAPGDLAALLDAHAYTTGLELLPDGTPTNNSAELRSPASPARDADVARALLDDGADPLDGTAGAQAADVLGLARGRLARVSGAGADRSALAEAAGVVVRLAASGPLPGIDVPLRPAPGGPAPVLRVGRQPYGLLPASAPGRWRPAAGEASAALAEVFHAWAWARGAAVDRDPALPWTAPPAARRVTRTDDAELHDLLVESATSLAFADYAGVDGLVGETPAEYLTALAEATDVDAVDLPDVLLARLALAARRAGADAAPLRVLAASDRADLARAVAGHLDTLSYRLDAWITAAATERLAGQRPAATIVGGYGYLTDVAPRTRPRSQGHVHAPSLAHAATAAVLRSGYLGQRRAAWAAAVDRARTELDAAASDAERAAAEATLADAEAGLADLRPLDPLREAALPLAIDLSSRRVREARALLAAVREGQPLAAVLGYRFERDLADAGLQQYLAAFRKLTRFATGTRLEVLEEARRQATEQLRLAQEQWRTLRAAVAGAAPAVAAATAAVQQAAAAEEAARAVAAPYLALQAELDELDSHVLAELEQALAAVDGERPEPGIVHRTIEVP